MTISDIPFQGPIAAVRMGKIAGELVVNPTFSQLKDSSFNIIVAGTKEALVMVEGSAALASEEEILEAMFTAHAQIQPILELQERMRAEVGKPKRPIPEVTVDEALKTRVEALSRETIVRAFQESEKQVRRQTLENGLQEALTVLGPEYEGREKEISGFYFGLEKTLVRDLVINQQQRIDGRGYGDIRTIACEVGLLSRTHGSALFTRGETQALALPPWGRSDEQKIETLNGETFKALCCIIISLLTASVKPACSGVRDAVRSVTARWQSAPWTGCCRLGGFSLYYPYCFRDPLVQRFLLYGHCLRRFPGHDGRRYSH